MSRRRAVAPALADALLSGPWEHAAMLERARAALAPAPRRLPELVRDVRAAYPSAPLDAPRELAAFVARVIVLLDGEAPRVVRHAVVQTAMAERRWPVAPLADLRDLGALLGLDAGALAWLADARGLERSAADERLRHYRWRFVARASGRAPRPIAAPKSRLKLVQRTLLREVLAPIPPHAAAHGFVPGRSAVGHAALHRGRALVLRVDLEDFFASIPARRVYGLMRTAGYPESVAHTLTALMTTVLPRHAERALDGHPALRRRMLAAHLPQGAPTSPALANLVAHRLDRRLAGLAASLGASYSRYADDLVLSGDRALLARRTTALRAVVAIARDEGFTVNASKTRAATAADRQTVTGVVVNARPGVARDERDRLRALLHDAAANGARQAGRGRAEDVRAHVLGRIGWVEQVNPQQAVALRRRAAEVDWAS